MLVAVGRAPLVEGLGLEEIGVELDRRKGIATDEHRRTTVPHIYAVGDCAGYWQLAHTAFREGEVAAENATGHDAVVDADAASRGRSTPIRRSPAVGLTEAEAREQHGDDVAVGVFPWVANARAVMQDGDGRVGEVDPRDPVRRAARPRHGRPARDRPDRGRRGRARRGGDGRDGRRRDGAAPDALGGDQGGRAGGARHGRSICPRSGRRRRRPNGRSSDGNRQQAERRARLADLERRQAGRPQEGEARPSRRSRAASRTGRRSGWRRCWPRSAASLFFWRKKKSGGEAPPQPAGPAHASARRGSGTAGVPVDGADQHRVRRRRADPAPAHLRRRRRLAAACLVGACRTEPSASRSASTTRTRAGTRSRTGSRGVWPRPPGAWPRAGRRRPRAGTTSARPGYRGPCPPPAGRTATSSGCSRSTPSRARAERPAARLRPGDRGPRARDRRARPVSTDAAPAAEPC